MKTFSVAYSFILVVPVMGSGASMLSTRVAAVQDVCETACCVLELDNLKEALPSSLSFLLPLNSKFVIHSGDLEL